MSKIYVSAIKQHNSGFGQFQRDEAVAMEGDWESVEEYAQYVASTNPLILSHAIDPEIAEMGDEDGEKLAAKIREVTGSVCGGHDTLVVYWLGNDEILVESIEIA